MKIRRILIKFFSGLFLFALLIGIYWVVIRPGQLQWGATQAEIASQIPGDAVVPNPTFKATRAITINGTAEEIWPWLVQMGYGRAGFYGYDLFENLGSPRGIQSADHIIPELQQLAAGDPFPIFPGSTMLVETIEPNRSLVLVGSEGYPDMVIAWTLVPVNNTPGAADNQTRLIIRVQFIHHWHTPALIGPILFTEFLDHLAVRRILLGVKGRVEGNIEPIRFQIGEITALVVGLLEFIAAVFLLLMSKRCVRAWSMALLIGYAFSFVVYAHAPGWINALIEVLILMATLYESRLILKITPLNNP